MQRRTDVRVRVKAVKPVYDRIERLAAVKHRTQRLARRIDDVHAEREGIGDHYIQHIPHKGVPVLEQKIGKTSYYIYKPEKIGEQD